MAPATRVCERVDTMRSTTRYLTLNVPARMAFVNITDEVERCRAAAGITEGFVLVSAMHISASVFVNDHEPGLWQDILEWLEERIAPWDAGHYQHNSGTGEDNAAAHLRSLGGGTLAGNVVSGAAGAGLQVLPGVASITLEPGQNISYGAAANTMIFTTYGSSTILDSTVIR